MYGDRDRGKGGYRNRGRGGTPLEDLDPALTEVSRRVIGCAIEVHKALGPGFPEQAYRRALELELKNAHVAFEPDRRFAIRYRDVDVAECVADMFIDGRFIVALLAERREIGGAERSALRAILRAADLELGLIINFGERRLKDGLVRVLNPDKLNAMRAEREEEYEEEDGEEYEDGDDYDDEDGDEHE